MVKLQQTYVIGLGRQGREALEHFKRRIQTSYGDLPAVKLLAIDASQVRPELIALDTPPAASPLGPSEAVDLPLDEIIDDPQAAQRLLPWLSDDAVTLGADWRRTRAAARAAWHTNLKPLLPFLIAHLNDMSSVDARTAMAAKGFDVATDRTEAALIVVGNLGDVAASALLLDVAYLFHHLYRTAGQGIASTALLFMPSVTQSEPAAEARAYAALKEINAFMGSGRAYRAEYEAGRGAAFVVESDAPAFNRGCYLVDTRNEKTLTLKDDADASRLAGEWLFRALLTPLKSRIDEFASTHGSMPWVQGQLAIYNSLGLAGDVVPIDQLITWSASRLGEAVISNQLLRPELFAAVADRVGNFVSTTHLKPDDLIGQELRRGKDGQPIKLQNDLISRLRTLPPDEIIPAVQATMNALGRDLLPSHKQQIEANARRAAQDIGELVDQEVTSILKTRPAGGLSMASQMVGRLRDDAARFQQSLQRREAALLARNQQQVNLLARQGPLLKQAAIGIPPWWMIAIGAAAGVAAPLALMTAALAQGLAGLGAAGLIALVAVWGLTLGGVAFAVWRTTRNVDRIRDQYVTYLQNRFEAELNLALVQAARALYGDATAAFEAKLEQLNGLADALHYIAGGFRQHVQTTALDGSVDFSLQRSALTPALVESLYQRYASQENLDAHVYGLTERYGSLDRWLVLRSDELEARLMEYGRALFAPMTELRVEPVLFDALPQQANLDRALRETHDKAAPLCTFNAYLAGQAPVSATQTFVGLESPEQGDLRAALERVDPTAVFEPSGDPHGVVVTTIRRGMPLFGLLRLTEFRRDYLDAVKKRSEPLHLDDELALTPDLGSRSTTQPAYALDPGTVFALALAFGAVARLDAESGADDASSPQSVFGVCGEQGQAAVSFTADKLSSAILLGADDKLLAEVDRRVQQHLTSQSGADTGAELSAYLRTGSISAWERRRIEDYIRLLRA